MSRLTSIVARLALLAAAAALAPTSAQAAVSLIVINENNTVHGDAIVEVYVSPTEATGWGPNRLRASVPPGDYAEIDLRAFGDQICEFDVMLVDEDGEAAEIAGVDLCTEPYIYFRE